MQDSSDFKLLGLKQITIPSQNRLSDGVDEGD
mgnify:CR=1 FL=1